MAKKKETLMVKNFADGTKGTADLVKDNYLNAFEFAFSLWKENMQIMNTQILNYWINLEKDFVKSAIDIYTQLPKEAVYIVGKNSTKAINDGLERMSSVNKSYFDSIHKNYINSVKKASDNSMKEALSIAHKNIEKTFSFFDGYLSLFRG